VKPLLLMDVDGPLNPFQAAWFTTSTPPSDFRFYALTPRDDRTYRVALSQEHGAQLRGLQDVFDLVWATTWRDEANRLISPILGLPDDLPVIPLFRTLRPARERGRCWKVDQVADWVGARGFAWFDDEINRRTRIWLRRLDGLGPHLALAVRPSRGLRADDFARLRSFAAPP